MITEPSVLFTQFRKPFGRCNFLLDNLAHRKQKTTRVLRLCGRQRMPHLIEAEDARRGGKLNVKCLRQREFHLVPFNICLL